MARRFRKRHESMSDTTQPLEFPKRDSKISIISDLVAGVDHTACSVPDMRKTKSIARMLQ